MSEWFRRVSVWVSDSWQYISRETVLGKIAE